MNQCAAKKARGKIVCVGQAVMDIVAGNVRKSAFARETTQVQSVRHLPGGHAVNHALCLRKLGKRVSFVGRVGADRFGLDILQELREAGVDVSGMRIDPTVQTSISLILVDAEGEKTILQRQTGNNAFALDAVAEDAFQGASIVCVGSLWSLPGLDGEGVATLFQRARAQGALTVADTGEDSKYVGVGPIIQALRYADCFLPSLRDARTITGLDAPEAVADALLEMGPSAVVIRMGADGCLAADRARKLRLPTLRVRAVDTTGAGDNFMAGFLAKLSEGEDLRACAVFANATGALSTLALGANSAAYDAALVAQRARELDDLIRAPSGNHNES